MASSANCGFNEETYASMFADKTNKTNKNSHFAAIEMSLRHSTYSRKLELNNNCIPMAFNSKAATYTSLWHRVDFCPSSNHAWCPIVNATHEVW